MPRLSRQIDFLLTCDRLKQVERTTYLQSGARAENSAEHSWHLALMALTLAEYAPAETNVDRVVRLLVVHDLVEIFAGDTHFDQAAEGVARQRKQEAQAAAQLFGRLPPDQQQLFMALWQEFEEQRTPEARFARALDALQPLLLTWGGSGQGCTDRYPQLTAERVLELKAPRLREFPALWTLAQQVVERAVADGRMPGECAPGFSRSLTP